MKKLVISLCIFALTCLAPAFGAELQNTGKDCWYKCNSKQGPCSWCGTAGTCCKKGFNDKSNGCDGTFGGSRRHECVFNQDNSMLLKVYEQINGFRRSEGISKIIRDRDLERLAQSAGFLTSHSQHKEQDEKAFDIARRKGWTLRRAAVNACTESTGCLASKHQFRNIKTEPVTIFKDFRKTHGHYEKVTTANYKYAGCSVIKKRVGSEYGYSVWCMLMG